MSLEQKYAVTPLYCANCICDMTDNRVLLSVQPGCKSTKNQDHAAACMWQPACQRVWPLLDLRHDGALAASGWDYWCQSLQAPRGTSEVMLRTDTHTLMASKRHTQATVIMRLTVCYISAIFPFSCSEERGCLISWLLHLVAASSYCSLTEHTAFSLRARTQTQV